MLDMGFKDDIFTIARSFNSSPQTLMYSATMPLEVCFIAQHLLNKPVFVGVGKPGSANMDIKQEVLLLEQSDKKEALVELLKQSRELGKGGRYCCEMRVFRDWWVWSCEYDGVMVVYWLLWLFW